MGRGPDVTSNREHDDSVVRIFTCFCGEGCESSSKNCQPGALQGGLTGGVKLHVIPILCKDDGLEAKKRRKRRVDFVKAKRAKRERESRLMEFVYLFYAFQTK